MKVALFIKSYRKDFEWLKYALKSIHKFCSGYEEIVIVVPDHDLEELKTFATNGEKLFGVQEYGEGYLFQQMIKMNAHNFTECEYIQYTDSDCIFHTPTKPDDYFQDGKPVMLKTRYGNLEGAEMWRSVVYDALGFLPDWEYMRRHMLIYHRETLMNIQKIFPKMNDYVMTRPGRHFSEFNVMGAFADKYEPERYVWKDTATTEFVPEKLKQFHSYSQYTKENIELIERMLL